MHIKKYIKYIALCMLVIIFLVRAGMEKGNYGWSKDLTESIIEEDKGRVEKLLQNKKMDVNRKSGNPLLNLIPECGQVLPIEAALETQNYDIIKDLIEAGAVVDETYEGDQNPIAAALLRGCKKQNFKTVELLLEHGADPDGNAEEGVPLLIISELYIDIYSTEEERQEAQEQLVKLYELVYKNCKEKRPADEGGETSLDYAAVSKNNQLVRYLVEQLGYDVNAQDHDGQTPLINLMYNGSDQESKKETARLLKQYGADESIRDKKGKTAEDYEKENE